MAQKKKNSKKERKIQKKKANIVPDIITGAKGINGAYLPLGMVG